MIAHFMPSIRLISTIFAAVALTSASCLGQEASDLATTSGPPALVWTNHANRAADSIPAGNGDIGINVWTEDNGDLLLYLSKTDAFDEHGRLLKLGRLRVNFSPAIQTTPQELKLRDGVITLGTGIRIWVDANHPVIHIEAENAAPFEQTVSLEMWRTEKRPSQHHLDRHGVDGMSATEPPLFHPDTIAVIPDQIVWYHRNAASVYPVSLKLQELDQAQCPPDPLLGRTLARRWLAMDSCR